MTEGKVDPAKLDAFLASGYSVVVLRVEAHVPALAAVCNEIKARMREGSQVGAIVTSCAGAGAFKAHIDAGDLVILQIEGTKRWQVFSPVVPNPVRGMPKQTLENPQPILDEVLEPGDLLFVPAGYWHHCESGLSTSVHIGVDFLPPTGWHAIDDTIRPLVSDELFRIPLNRLDEARFEAVEQEIKDRAIETIKALKFEDFVARHTTPFKSSRRCDREEPSATPGRFQERIAGAAASDRPFKYARACGRKFAPSVHAAIWHRRTFELGKRARRGVT
jgi:ribosomal protein L16 Arg81 hydroxylase